MCKPLMVIMIFVLYSFETEYKYSFVYLYRFIYSFVFFTVHFIYLTIRLFYFHCVFYITGDMLVLLSMCILYIWRYACFIFTVHFIYLTIRLFYFHCAFFLTGDTLVMIQSTHNVYVLLVLYLLISDRLLSVLRGHSFFSSTPQRPMASDFEGFLYQILSITLFSYLNSWERTSIF